MSERIKILLQDDTEILGNGLGHVMTRIYLPVMQYLKILLKNEIKSTFFIDIAHLLFLKRNQSYKDFEFQIKVFEETILSLINSGMDIQLHIHPQWNKIRTTDDYKLPTDSWNLGKLSEPEQNALINNCVTEINALIQKSNKRIVAFKAGAWGLQPFGALGNTFKENNIKLILGPIKDLKINGLGIDYSGMEESLQPYYCNPDNFNKIGTKRDDLIIIPVTPSYLTLLDTLRYGLFTMKRRFEIYFDKPLDIDFDFPYNIIKAPKTNERIEFNSIFRPIKTHLKINTQPFWYLKNTFEKSIKYINSMSPSYPLITIETHTKDFKNSFSEVNKFFKYIKKKYPDIEFITINDLMEDILAQKCIPKSIQN